MKDQVAWDLVLCLTCQKVNTAMFGVVCVTLLSDVGCSLRDTSERCLVQFA